MKKSIRNIIILVVSLVIVSAILLTSIGVNLNPLSILSSSSISVNDGKVYWTESVNINGNGDTFTFTPRKYSFNDGSGTTVTPQKSLSLRFDKQDSYCDYTLQKYSWSNCLGLFYGDYYLLTNPQRVVNVKITDGNGEYKSMDATISGNSVRFNSGGGSAVVQSQGTLGGKTDCPNYENIVVAKSTDGNYYAYTLSEYNAYRQSQNCNLLTLSGIYRIFFPPQPSLNTQFSSSFTTYPTITNTNLRGYLGLGSGVFTITADQAYFGSVVYTPPRVISPRITSITMPDIVQGTSGSASVRISNDDNGAGTIQVTATSSDLSIYPSTQNVYLDRNAIAYFTFTGVDKAKSSRISVTACSNSQFGENNCDTESKGFNILSNGNIVPYCGDNICSSNENNASCPTDCLVSCPSSKILVNGNCVDLQTECTSCSQWALNLFKKKENQCQSVSVVKGEYSGFFSYLNPLNWAKSAIDITGLTNQNIICPLLFIIFIAFLLVILFIGLLFLSVFGVTFWITKKDNKSSKRAIK